MTEVATERAQRFQSRVLEVLVEGANPKDPKQVCGSPGCTGVTQLACMHTPLAAPVYF